MGGHGLDLSTWVSMDIFWARIPQSTLVFVKLFWSELYHVGLYTSSDEQKITVENLFAKICEKNDFYSFFFLSFSSPKQSYRPPRCKLEPIFWLYNISFSYFFIYLCHLIPDVQKTWLTCEISPSPLQPVHC